MSNTYTWVIESLDCVPSLNGQTNVVCNIHWSVTAVSEQGKTITTPEGVFLFSPFLASTKGIQALDTSTISAFIPYENLTKKAILKWLLDALGAEQVVSIETSLDNGLNALANPPVVSLPLPWANNA